MNRSKSDNEDANNITETNSVTTQKQHKICSYYIDATSLQHSHETIYLRLLGLENTGCINPDKIIKAYYNTILEDLVEDNTAIFLMTKNDKSEVTKAACDYLMDRCNYLGFMN